MSEFLNAKIHFELKYTHILNFRNIYKEILSPYLILSTGFRIFNENTNNEYIQIIFDDDLFQIDCRWDRMILTSEGSLEKFKDTRSVYKIYFEVFKNIKELPSFGRLNNYVAVGYGVKIYEDDEFDELMNKFKDKYLQDEIYKFSDRSRYKDIGIRLDYEESEISSFINFGPYKPEKDIKNLNLMPFKSEELSKLKDNYGFIIEYKVSSTEKDVDYSTFIEFMSLLENTYENFDI